MINDRELAKKIQKDWRLSPAAKSKLVTEDDGALGGAKNKKQTADVKQRVPLSSSRSSNVTVESHLLLIATLHSS
jgi:hypothetical protein